MSKINLEHEIINDEYTEYVYSTFDIQDSDKTSTEIIFDLSEMNESDWNIGIILGSSGSGKSSILRSIGNIPDVKFDTNKALISNFNFLDPKEATFALTSVGLSSVPTWLRPFHLLSNGEQYRAKLAYLIASSKDGEIILIDEYTSVVDRYVAKSMSFAIQKYVRKLNKKIIIASVHYDVLEWLLPDWSVNLQNGGMSKRHDCRRQGRPKIDLQVYRTEPNTWEIFKKHHYLTSESNKGFGYLVFVWDDIPVGICVYKTFPTGNFPNGYALSRTVVLPDFQGMGIGKSISEFTAGIIVHNGGRLFTKTINPALGEHRNKSPLWRGTSKNGKYRSDIDYGNSIYKRRMMKKVLSRTSYCHEYIGKPISGHDELLLPIKIMRIQKKQKLSIF